MITNLGWGTFLLWGLFDAVIAIVTFLFLKETKGLSLEEIAHNDFGQILDHKTGLDEVQVQDGGK
jgi:Sugar (and other) transporter